MKNLLKGTLAALTLLALGLSIKNTQADVVELPVKQDNDAIINLSYETDVDVTEEEFQPTDIKEVRVESISNKMHFVEENGRFILKQMNNSEYKTTRGAHFFLEKQEGKWTLVVERSGYKGVVNNEFTFVGKDAKPTPKVFRSMVAKTSTDVTELTSNVSVDVAPMASYFKLISLDDITFQGSITKQESPLKMSSKTSLVYEAFNSTDRTVTFTTDLEGIKEGYDFTINGKKAGEVFDTLQGDEGQQTKEYDAELTIINPVANRKGVNVSGHITTSKSDVANANKVAELG